MFFLHIYFRPSRLALKGTLGNSGRCQDIVPVWRSPWRRLGIPCKHDRQTWSRGGLARVVQLLIVVKVVTGGADSEGSEDRRIGRSPLLIKQAYWSAGVLVASCRPGLPEADLRVQSPNQFGLVLPVSLKPINEDSHPPILVWTGLVLPISLKPIYEDSHPPILVWTGLVLPVSLKLIYLWLSHVFFGLCLFYSGCLIGST